MLTSHNRIRDKGGEPYIKLFSVVETLGKSSACIAVMGYLSARWHWNVLGISMIKPLSLSAYLTETLLFVVQTAWRLAITGTVVLIALGIVLLALRGLSTQSMHLPQSVLDSDWVGWIVLVLSTFLALSLISVTSSPGDLLVGPLDEGAVHRLTEYKWLRNAVGSAYETLWFILMSVGFLVIKQRASPSNRARYFLPIWTIARIPVLLGFITLPMVFGTFVRPVIYPTAAISWSLGEQKFLLCGVLVGSDGESVVLWEQNRSYGVVVKVPEKAITSLVTGPLTQPLSMRADPAGPEARLLQDNCNSLRLQSATSQ